MAGVLALSSLLTPFCLGTVIGSVVTGRAGAHGDPASSWVNSTSLLTGALFVAVTAYLTAVYLAVDSERGGEHGLRAISPGALAAGVLSGILAAVTMAVPGLEKDLASMYKKFATPVANVYGAFRTADLMDMVTSPAFGTVPLNVAMVCSYTWECAPPPVGPNQHANVLGYGVIANTFPKIYIGLSKAG